MLFDYYVDFNVILKYILFFLDGWNDVSRFYQNKTSTFCLKWHFLPLGILLKQIFWSWNVEPSIALLFFQICGTFVNNKGFFRH